MYGSRLNRCAAWKSTLSLAVFVHRVWVFAYPSLKGHCTLVCCRFEAK